MKETNTGKRIVRVILQVRPPAGLSFFFRRTRPIFAQKKTAMDILQKPDALCFATALKDIIIQTDKNIDLSFRVQDQTPFLHEAYWPDAENKIYIRDLGKLFLPYISGITLRETFIITLTESGSSASITTTVLYGLAEIDIPAADFLDISFLTHIAAFSSRNKNFA
jgi:hypothetical protein